MMQMVIPLSLLPRESKRSLSRPWKILLPQGANLCPDILQNILQKSSLWFLVWPAFISTDYWLDQVISRSAFGLDLALISGLASSDTLFGGWAAKLRGMNTAQVKTSSLISIQKLLVTLNRLIVL